jgi:hypothetical protein
MYTNLQLTTIEHFTTGANDASHARRMAAKSFDRLFAAGKLAQLFSRLNGKSNMLKVLEHQPEATSRRTTATLDIPIDQIVGSVSRSQDFDAHFNPLQMHDRERWIGVAAARRSGVILPAVELVRGEDGYYVRDGHHRISVAKAMGQVVIEARIVN